jgi:hypothetical protein
MGKETEGKTETAVFGKLKERFADSLTPRSYKRTATAHKKKSTQELIC